jgi:hypothetical protein
MATLEERIQNLTQDINPMGAMSDMDAERLMIIQQPQEFISNPKGQSTKLRMEAMLRLPKGSLSDSDALRMLQMMGGELNTQALPSVYQTLKSLVGDSRNETVGSGVMSDRDAQRVMAALGDNNRAGRIFEDNENFFREMRIGDEVVYKGDNQVMSQDVFRAENPYARPTVASESTRGTMSDIEGDMVMNAMPDAVRANKSLLSGVPDPMMSGVDTSIMQPLVEMGFEKQVRVILSTPQNSPESIEAQHQIINEMGTGMDIDAFVQTVREVAPPAIQEELLRDRMQPVGAMSNIDAEVMQRLMSAGRDGDTAIGHLTEGEVVIPAPVLEANPQAANMLEQTMTQMGIDPRTRVVDSTGEIGGIASINPETGFQEFGFLSDVWKKAKKVVKAVAPIAVNFIPGVGPLAKAALTAGIGKASGLSTKDALLGGALSYGGSKLFGGTPAAGKASTGNIFSRAKDYVFKGSDGIGLLGNLGKSAYNAYDYVMPGSDGVGLFGNVKSGIGSLFGGGQPEFEMLPDGTYKEIASGDVFGIEELRQAGKIDRAGNLVNSPVANAFSDQSNLGRIEDLFKTVTGDDGMTRTEELVSAGYSPEDIEVAKANGTFNALVAKARSEGKVVSNRGAVGAIQNALTGGGDSTTSGGMGMMGKLGIAGLAGLIGKLAYEEAKDQKGVPLTPLTQMDQLGRYNIEAEIARRTGAEAPSRVEFGLNPEGMPALSGGSPRMAAYGGIMNLNMGGMPRYNYGGGVQYFNQGGTVAMAEGGDMDATINIEDFPVKDGQIDGPGTEVSDDIPAMLSDGEFVMTAKAVKGAGSFNINDNNGILTLTPNGDPSRDSGTRVMYKLMEHFGKVA